jgi:hypothetical protein
MNASISNDLRSISLDAVSGTATVPVPNGWDDVKPLVGRVLLVDGVAYGFTGWNSDRLVAYFRRNATIAQLK